MEDLAKLIPTSLSSFVGMAVIIVILIMIGTVAQKWGEALYRSMRGNKEKRHDNNHNYNGVERRSDAREIEHAMADLIKTLNTKEEVLTDFVSTWKKSHFELKENVEEIKRKQDKNWHRLFEEELPIVRGDTR